MSTKKKLLQAAAGSAGGEVLDVDDVFSTYLYDGTGSALTINNGLDLSGEGGLVWTKRRDHAGNGHMLVDTARGGSSFIKSNTTDAANTSYTLINSFNSNGYTLSTNGWVNGSGDSVCSWTFRKAPKFFDIVTYTGNGTAGRTVSHNLGSVPGMIIVKSTSNAESWYVYHRGVDATAPEDYFLELEKNAARTNAAYAWNDTAPTSTEFTVGAVNDTNQNGATFVAYLFAHNDGDGNFGPDGDADIIKCGSYTGNGSSTGPTVNLGFEPQWIMIKRTDSTSNWFLFDSMRGLVVGGNDSMLRADLSNAENTVAEYINVNPTGFSLATTSTSFNASGGNYIYMAIRRGPLAEPESATDVFAVDLSPNSNDPRFISGFPVDMAMQRSRSSTGVDGMYITSRLTANKSLLTGSTNAEASTTTMDMDYMNGFDDDADTATNHIAHMWKRAPSYFDVVTFTGTGATQAINHNLGVVPEMMWLKKRNGSFNWQVYHSGLNSGTDPEDYYLILNATSDEANNSNRWNDTAPTATQFTVNGAITDSGSTQIMYLFASLDGISKVSHYTGTGADGHQIDCGFSSGARFVLIKRVDQNEDWMVFDTERGIVSGNDSYLRLNLSNAENTGNDLIDPYSSGFAVNNDAKVNASGGRYVFYAIA